MGKEGISKGKTYADLFLLLFHRFINSLLVQSLWFGLIAYSVNKVVNCLLIPSLF